MKYPQEISRIIYNAIYFSVVIVGIDVTVVKR